MENKVKFYPTIYEDRNYKLYVHICKTKNKYGNYGKYFGITKQEPEKRWSNGKGYNRGCYFGNSIKKYGWDGFYHFVFLDNLTQKEAKILENKFILFYKANNRRFGYNRTDGGESPIFNEDAKNKMKKNSANRKGENNPMFGRKLSKQQIKKMRQGLEKKYKKVICLEDKVVYSCAKQASNITGIDYVSIWNCCNRKFNIAKDKHFLYKEDYDKLSEGEILDIINTKRKFGTHIKAIINIDTGEIFNSMKEAGEKYGVNPKNFYNAITRNHKTSGFRWRYYIS